MNGAGSISPACVQGDDRSRAKRRKYRCMFRDDKGRWWLDYYTPDGKRRRKLAGNTKGDADRLLRQIRTTIDKGEYVDASRAPGFTDFCKIFMDRYGQHKTSYVDGTSRIERLKTYFGNRKISTITAGHIEEYRLTRQNEPDARD